MLKVRVCECVLGLGVWNEFLAGVCSGIKEHLRIALSGHFSVRKIMQFRGFWTLQSVQGLLQKSRIFTSTYDRHYIATATSAYRQKPHSQIFPPPQANHITTSTSSKSRSPPTPPLILHHPPSPKLNRALCLSDNVTPPSASSTSAKIPNNRSVSDPGRPRLNGRSRRTRAIFPPCLL